MVPWANPSQHPKQNPDQISHFCRVHSCNWHTDIQDHAATDGISLNSMGPTPTRTSSPTSAWGSSHGSRRVRWLPHSACHQPDTHDDPRRLVRRLFLTRMSVRDAPVYTCSVHDKLSCTRLQNYTIGASLKSVSVSVPWNRLISTDTTYIFYGMRWTGTNINKVDRP